MLKYCKLSLNSARTAAQSLEYFSKKDSAYNPVHHVLADLCTQLDSTDLVESDIDEDDRRIFQVALDLHENRM